MPTGIFESNLRKHMIVLRECYTPVEKIVKFWWEKQCCRSRNMLPAPLRPIPKAPPPRGLRPTDRDAVPDSDQYQPASPNHRLFRPHNRSPTQNKKTVQR